MKSKKVKLKLKDAILAAKRKYRNPAYKYTIYSFTDKIGPYSSSIDKIIAYDDGHVRVESAFVVNKRYDYKEHGSKYIGTGKRNRCVK